jgi:hypothetical protein
VNFIAGLLLELFEEVTSKSGHSASIKIYKRKHADEISFVRSYLRDAHCHESVSPRIRFNRGKGREG